MKATRRTTIRFEKHELKIVRMARYERLLCEMCEMETAHLPIAQIAMLLSVSEKTVFCLAEYELIHSTETEGGNLLICMNSVGSFSDGKI